jgi:hypothetical protein
MSELTSNSLSRCPFCGSDQLDVRHTTPPVMEYVKCLVCHACGPNHEIAHWNERPTHEPAPDATIKAAAARVEKDLNDNDYVPEYAADLRTLIAYARSTQPPPVDAVAGFDVFRHYVETNMPPNTVIGNPNWWAQRLWKQAVYAINEARSALTKCGDA